MGILRLISIRRARRLRGIRKAAVEKTQIPFGDDKVWGMCDGC
jgi:hypothetical protein